jgi:hypothetical protein
LFPLDQAPSQTKPPLMLAPEGAWVEPLIARSRSEVMTYWSSEFIDLSRRSIIPSRAVYDPCYFLSKKRQSRLIWLFQTEAMK